MIHEITFWIAIAYFCSGNDCGMATSVETFKTKESCISAIDAMKLKLQASKSLDKIDTRCSRNTILVHIDNDTI
jgi:uncharacterized protein YegP (UPF0339 family)